MHEPKKSHLARLDNRIYYPMKHKLRAQLLACCNIRHEVLSRPGTNQKVYCNKNLARGIKTKKNIGADSLGTPSLPIPL
jgi:hypothetical protein